MRMGLVVPTAVLAAFAPLVAEAQTTAPTPTAPNQEALASVIGMPQWDRPPAVEFPAAAMNQRISTGRAGVECGVQADGRLTNCKVILEQPTGAGFGEEILRAASEARLTRRSMSNAAPNAMVRFTANFILQ